MSHNKSINPVAMSRVKPDWLFYRSTEKQKQSVEMLVHIISTDCQFEFFVRLSLAVSNL